MTAAASTSTAKRCSEKMAVPDTSSLSAIPIRAGSSNSRGDDDNSEVIRLLPRLFNSTHTDNDKEEGAGDNSNDNSINEKISSLKNHPCHELVRISHDLEIQLKERLQDASDGAKSVDKDTNAQLNQSSSSEIQEEFLLRSEAILSELLSAVQQHMRKEKSSRTDSSGSRKGKKRKAAGQATDASSPPLKYYTALTKQLQTLQDMPNVTDISLHKSSSNHETTNNDNTPADLTHISVTCLDAKKRSHTWHAELYPSIILTMDLPSEFVLEDKNVRLDKWWEDGPDSMTTSVLPRIQQQFEQTLEKYQSLFNELDDLDSNLWILEPSLPARRESVERRIALWEGGASMVIVLDPDNARGVPVMTRFLGVTLATMTAAANASDAQGDGGDGSNKKGGVVDWRASFADFVAEDSNDGKVHSKKKAKGTKSKGNRNSQATDNKDATDPKHWSEERSVRENLELWFGSELPSPLSTTTEEKSDFLVECGVCYTHRLPVEDSSMEEGPLPEAKCSNPSCNRHYHETCLFEWLHSLPTARVSFDRIFGTCPYCCETLSVRVLSGGRH